jgi:hypothetical protein
MEKLIGEGMEYLKIIALQKEVIKELEGQASSLQKQSFNPGVVLDFLRRLSERWDSEAKNCPEDLKNCSSFIEFRNIINWLEQYFLKIQDFMNEGVSQDFVGNFADLASNSISDMLKSMRMWEKQFAIEAKIVSIKQVLEGSQTSVFA